MTPKQKLFSLIERFCWRKDIESLESAVILVALLMLSASIYEGCLERRYRIAHAHDLELAEHEQKAHNNNVEVAAKPTRDPKEDKDLRREICGVWSELLLSFSVLSNGRTILSTDRPSDSALMCLHGMRFMSVIWVIMVHTYLTVFYVADNKTMRVVTERNFAYQSVGNASYCVDTFFFISGLLVTVLFLRTEDKKAAKKAEKKPTTQPDINKNVNGYTNSALSVSVISQQSFCEDLMDKKPPKGYSKRETIRMIKDFFVLFSYRVVRLTPAYAFVIGLNLVALRYVHYTSVFDSAVADHITCDHFWWRNLLYINNLFPQREMCMVWSWYMANDTQFYVVGIIILLLSVKHTKLSWGLLGLILISSWVTTIYISVSHNYKARIQEPFEMFDPLYDKPWSRIGPYLVGMIVGWYLYKSKCQVKLPYWLVALGWPCSLAVFGSLIFGMVDGYFEVWPTAFYVSVGHTAWGVALAWVAVACCCGYGGLVNSALSYRGLLPLSRLTYCAYLVHPTIMMYTSALLDGPLHMQNSMVADLLRVPGAPHHHDVHVGAARRPAAHAELYGGEYTATAGLLPLSRLTYCAYLVHPTIMMYTSALLDGPLHMQNSMVADVLRIPGAPHHHDVHVGAARRAAAHAELYGGEYTATAGVLPLSMLTYCAYLVHPIDGPLHMQNSMVVSILQLLVYCLQADVLRVPGAPHHHDVHVGAARRPAAHAELYGGEYTATPGLLPLSRLTYCAYLVHPTIMMYTSALLDGPLHMQNSMVVSILQLLVYCLCPC
ncbi:acyltransferase family domain-containing protein [Phthorimaea operculella]|nr:acyltransferase family domain-containing protein [Phthorimaea operculella]